LKFGNKQDPNIMNIYEPSLKPSATNTVVTNFLGNLVPMIIKSRDDESPITSIFLKHEVS